MRILFCGNNRLGWQVARWLQEQGENLVGFVLHPEGKRKYGKELQQCAGDSRAPIVEATTLSRQATLDAIGALQPDVALSVLFGYILRNPFLDLFPQGCVNLHPSLLPYNRGAHPNIWSIVEGTPAGATLHYIDEGVDTGAIIAQRSVRVDPTDTGGSLYHKLEATCLELFQSSWPVIRTGSAPRRMQNRTEGTSHRVKDVTGIEEIDLERCYVARELINVMRALTFPPYPGAYYWDGGEKVHVRIELTREGETR